MIMSQNTAMCTALCRNNISCCAKNSFRCHVGRRYTQVFLRAMTAAGGRIVPSTSVVGCLRGAMAFALCISLLHQWPSLLKILMLLSLQRFLRTVGPGQHFFFLQGGCSSCEYHLKIIQYYWSCLQCVCIIYFIHGVESVYTLFGSKAHVCVSWLWEQTTWPRLLCPGSVSRSICLSTSWTGCPWLSASDVS